MSKLIDIGELTMARVDPSRREKRDGDTSGSIQTSQTGRRAGFCQGDPPTGQLIQCKNSARIAPCRVPSHLMSSARTS